MRFLWGVKWFFVLLKRKRSCFAPFLKKRLIFASTLIVFARPHCNAVSVLKTLLYPQCACSNKLDACTFQYIGPRGHMVASVRHFGYSRWSGLEPGRIYLMTSPLSDSIVFSLHARKQRFQKASFWNRSILESVFEWLRFRWSFSAL